MGAVPARILVRRTWSPPDVLGVSGYQGKRPWRSRHPPFMTDKPSLRAAMRASRLAFPAVPIVPSPDFRDRLRPGLVVASYRPLVGEADPALLEDAARVAGCAIALPRVTRREEPMRFHRWTDQAFVPGPFGIQQPSADSPVLTPDIVLTPLVAFDRAGQRLGQGAGYYDQAFAALSSAWRVGIGWSVQEVERVPVDPWDVPLHAIATEKEWITP